jgi:ribonuclease HII
VAACILDPEKPVFGINDSKKLSEKKRDALFDEICEKALAYKIVFVGPDVIDRENILAATMDGMCEAVNGLDITPNLVLVDGNRCPPQMQLPCQAVVKGDGTSASIGAASILAKVSRDRYMEQLDKEYPQYQLAKHKGYPTKLHYELIEQYGIQDFYRRSFLKKQGYWHPEDTQK